MHISLSYLAVYQKLTQHCTSTRFQNKQIGKNEFLQVMDMFIILIVVVVS